MQPALRHRRQFLLSSESEAYFPGWQRETVGAELFLSVHPDLELTSVSAGDRQLVLLGYCLDPMEPAADNAAILRALLPYAGDHHALTAAMARLGGRYVIIARAGAQVFLSADACGLRTVVFTDPKRRPFMSASQPGLIAHITGWHPDEQARREFMGPGSSREYWWPGGVTLYNEIFQLPPNHYLDLVEGRQERFWPRRRCEPLEMEAGAYHAAELLKGILAAAAARFKLGVAMTAGLDSRIVLAATRELSDDIFYYTLLYYDLTPESPDVAVPRDLLSRLGRRHHTLDCRGTMDEPFAALYHNNVEMAHPAWGEIACGLQRHYPATRISVRGSCCEVSRSVYYRFAYPRRIDGHFLAERMLMRTGPLAVAAFERWLEPARVAAAQTGFELLDLAYWEHRLGSWQAMSLLEWDLVQESFSPFNCRELLETLLRVDRRYRLPPYPLHRRIINLLWPGALAVPINPAPVSKRVQFMARQLLGRLGIYHILRSLGRRLGLHS